MNDKESKEGVMDNRLDDAIRRRHARMIYTAEASNNDIDGVKARLESDELFATQEGRLGLKRLLNSFKRLYSQMVSPQFAALATLVIAIGSLFISHTSTTRSPTALTDQDTLRGGNGTFIIDIKAEDPYVSTSEWESDLIGVGAKYSVEKCQSDCVNTIKIEASRSIADLNEEHKKQLENWSGDQVLIIRITKK